MDGGEVDFSNHELFAGTNLAEIGTDLLSNWSMDSLFDELHNKDTQTCIHAHTCNPPGPDASHTHTCYHVHTKTVHASSGDKDHPGDDTAESTDKKSRKPPVGNREAVRKYRNKIKEKAASLEDEVIRLREKNQQLEKRLQGQAVLEAENHRLKCLLVDIRGRIEGEIGAFPYQKPAKSVIYQNPGAPNLPGAYVMNPCSNDQVYCENFQCLGNQSSAIDELTGCGIPGGVSATNISGELPPIHQFR